MKKKAIWIIVLLIVIALVVALVVRNTGEAKTNFIVENGDDGVITVTADKAGKGAGGLGYLTIAEGQEFVVKPDLQNGSSILLRVFKEDMEDILQVLTELSDETTPALMQETITGTETVSFALQPDDYIILISVPEGRANGSVIICAE